MCTGVLRLSGELVSHPSNLLYRPERGIAGYLTQLPQEL